MPALRGYVAYCRGFAVGGRLLAARLELQAKGFGPRQALVSRAAPTPARPPHVRRGEKHLSSRGAKSDEGSRTRSPPSRVPWGNSKWGLPPSNERRGPGVCGGRVIPSRLSDLCRRLSILPGSRCASSVGTGEVQDVGVPAAPLLPKPISQRPSTVSAWGPCFKASGEGPLAPVFWHKVLDPAVAEVTDHETAAELAEVLGRHGHSPHGDSVDLRARRAPSGCRRRRSRAPRRGRYPARRRCRPSGVCDEDRVADGLDSEGGVALRDAGPRSAGGVEILADEAVEEVALEGLDLALAEVLVEQSTSLWIARPL